MMTTPYGYPSDLYHCLLDEQPYYLVPPRLFRPAPAPGGPLMVNPLSWFSWHGPLPPDKATRATAAEHVLPGEGVVWVDDPGTRALWPYSVGAEYIGFLRTMAPGQLVTIDLPARVRWVLHQADVLVEPGHVERRRRAWHGGVHAAARSFDRGFTSVNGLIPPFHLGALRRYYRVHARLGTFALGAARSARLVAHDEAIARFVHHQLATAVADLAHRIVMPSYSYVVAYQPGSVLERHIERDQCEYSISLCVDATPEPEAQSPWPIRLDLPEGSLSLWQYLGDALLYRGRSLPHQRDRLDDGYTSTSLLLHYVDEDFRASLS